MHEPVRPTWSVFGSCLLGGGGSDARSFGRLDPGHDRSDTARQPGAFRPHGPREAALYHGLVGHVRDLFLEWS